jgi:GNAT superfamily N-acetyltransferase
MRNYRCEDDYWRIREFLRQVLKLNKMRLYSWHLARLDYWRYFCNVDITSFPLEEVVFIWETADGQIAAVLNPESGGHAFLQVHPLYRSAELEEEMIEVAEQRLPISKEDGQRKLFVWADSLDKLRQDILLRRGYAKDDEPAYQRRRALDAPITEADSLQAQPSPGYTVRALGDEEELPARSWASWRAFHPDEPDENYEGWEWYTHIQQIPTYRRDLDIVAVAPTGESAAFCTVWFDGVTRSGVFEPVGTVPEHQRKGLGKALMHEGLRRLERLGATLAYVDSYTPAAHALYAAAGFTEYDLSEAWAKEMY